MSVRLLQFKNSLVVHIANEDFLEERLPLCNRSYSIINYPEMWQGKITEVTCPGCREIRQAQRREGK